MKEIAETISEVVRDLPNSPACEVIESGICLTGGSAFIAAKTSMDVRPAFDPINAVIRGARKMLAHDASHIPRKTLAARNVRHCPTRNFVPKKISPCDLGH